MNVRRQSLAELLEDRRPGYSLAQAFYTNPAIYELERVVYRNWILAGHVSELPGAGDFKVFEVARESVIIVRGEDGELRAFANVCRHRGSLVCLEDRGTTREFTCPYHGWMYGLDGRLTATRPGEIGYGYSRSSLFGKYSTGSRDGQPVAPLLGEFTGYDQGAAEFTFGAFSFLLAYSDHVVAYVFTPVEHQRSRCEIYWLVRGDAQEGRDYDVDELTWLWDITTQADKEIIVNNSKGVHSRFYEPGPFSTMEAMESNYVDWILQELRRE